MNAKLLSRLGIEVWKDIPEFEGIYQVSNFKHLDTVQVYGSLQHCTVTDREDNLLSVYMSNNRTLALVKILGHSKMNRV